MPDLLPATAKRLEAVELVRITSAAWRTYAARTPRPAEAELVSVAVGTLPGTADGWKIGAGDAHRPEYDGWHAFTDAQGDVWPILIDRTAPEIRARSPEPDSQTADLRLAVNVSDAGAGLAPGRTRLVINDVEVPTDQLVFDPVSGRLEVALGNVPGLAVANGGELEAQVSVFDRLGQMAGPTSWRWRYRAKALAFGNLNQLTLDGGQHPAWLPDGSGFVFVAERDGQQDLARFDLATSDVTWLTETALSEGKPAVSGDGVIAYVLDGDIAFLEADPGLARISGAFTGVTWAAGRWLATVGNRVVDPQNAETPLCVGATGATLEHPRPFGDGVLVTQSIYHRTVWFCDSETDAMEVFSAYPEAPDTRDVDATGVTGDTYFYAKDDGAQGIWRRGIGNRREALVLANGGGFDRRAAVAPDGRSMLFESSRTGRAEIWRLDFDHEMRFALDSGRVEGAAGQTIAGTAENLSDGAVWRLLDETGAETDFALTGTVTDDRFEIALAEDLPEGRWQLEVETANGMRQSSEITVDRTPPIVTLQRVQDRLPAEDVDVVREQDRFELSVEDVSTVRILEAGTGQVLVPGARLEPREAAWRLVATDATGLRTEIAFDLSVGAIDRSRVTSASVTTGQEGPEETPPKADEVPAPNPETTAGDGLPVWIVLAAIAVLAAIGGAVVLRRSS